MNIEKTDEEIAVYFDDYVVRYRRDSKEERQNYLTSEGVEKLEEWKIDLIKNHGVNRNELRSTD